ncbi:MAG: DegT/DnrJ/EryC1/StrS family aminotransferase [Myxococcales bacterium]|nr:DegT/DnrJ/EryC1/StrS family aminotransferase [Myxococcales bacterium]
MIPFVDLSAQYREIGAELEAAVHRVLASGRYALGPEVEAFENEFAAEHGATEGVAVSSGTAALHLALLAAGVGPGDEVITTPLTFVATIAAILYTGARPVLVDVDPRTYTLNPEAVAAAVTPRTKALLPVHLYGQPADLDPLLAVAERHGLRLIEDAAQAHGAVYRGRPVGGIGHLGCFSFYPAKNLGACGEGGIVLTSDPDLARLLRLLRNWGEAGKNQHVLKGFNYRLDALQGAILRVKLRHLAAWNEARRTLADRYRSLLDGLTLTLPAERRAGEHVYHVFALLVDRRERVRQALRERGIECGVHYPLPVHLIPAYAELGYPAGRFPIAEHIAAMELSLPIYPELTAAQQEEIALALRQTLAV